MGTRPTRIAVAAAITALAALALWATAGTPQTQEQVDLAKQIWQERNCARCHTLAGKGAAGPGPDLTKVGERQTLEWMRHWLRNPQATKPGTIMPTFNWTDKQLDAMIAYLLSFAKAKPSAKPAAAPHPQAPVTPPARNTVARLAWPVAVGLAIVLVGGLAGARIAANRRRAAPRAGPDEHTTTQQGGGTQ